MVVRFSKIGRKTRWPLEDAFQGRKVSWGRGVTARCRLFSVRVVEGSRVFTAAGTGVASAAGAAGVDSGAATGSVAAGAVVAAGAGGAVAAPPQARTNNRNNTRGVTVNSFGFLNRWYIMA
jgi:hypothetical protein